MFFNGLGCDVNKKMAFCYFAEVVTKAETFTLRAQVGEALFYLGLFYLNGDSTIPKDESVAAQFFLSAALKYPYDKLACLKRAIRFYRKTKNLDKLIESYAISVRLGAVPYMLNLADMYLEGKECTKNLRLALQLYQAALKGNNPSKKELQDAISGLLNTYEAMANSLGSQSSDEAARKTIREYLEPKIFNVGV